MTLKTPTMQGDDLAFDVDVLEGNLDGADGPASVFIDIIGMPFTPLSYAGVARRTRSSWCVVCRRRRRRSRGCGCCVRRGRCRLTITPTPILIRRAPACGYYPYPPCY